MATRPPQHLVPVREPIAITCHIPQDRVVFAGETFRAKLRFRNDAPYTLERLTYLVEIQTPSLRRVTLHKTTSQGLAPKEEREAVVEYKLAEPNEYLFRVSVAYTDFTGEARNTSPMPERISAPKALDESARRVHLLKGTPSGGLPSSLSPSSPGRYLVTIALINKASVGLWLNAIRFVPRDPSVVVTAQPRVAAHPIVRTSHGEALPADEERDPFMPYDTMRFVAEVQLRGPSAPSASPAPSDAIFYSSSAASVALGHVDLGHFEWGWSREGKATGEDASSVFRIARAAPEPDTDLQVLAVHPRSPRVGDVVTLTLQISNNATDKRDVSVATHIGKLLPCFLYDGPLLMLIGTVAPRTAVIARVQLVAHYPGFCALSGAIELRDTARPEVTLWPVFPGSGGGAAAGTASVAPQSFVGAGQLRPDAQQPTTTNLSAPEGWPPKLADIFVTYPSDDDEDENSDDDDDDDDACNVPDAEAGLAASDVYGTAVGERVINAESL